MARPRGFSRSPTRSRRQTAWGFGPGGTGITTFTASGIKIIGAQLVLASGILETTIVRLRGQLEIILQTTGGVGQGFRGAFGIGVVTTAAATIGITAVPSPITELDWDGWMYYTMFGVHHGLAAVSDGSGHERIDVDTKAMRKFGDEQTLLAVMEVVEIGTADMDVFFDSRMLLKLH